MTAPTIDPQHQIAPLRGAVEEPGSVFTNEHPLIEIPFSAFIDGRQFAGEGLSLVEAHVIGLADQGLDGEERLIRISFEFQGFDISVRPKVRIVRKSARELVLHFSEPTGDHLPQLRHILNEYISGDLTSLGSVIRAGALVGGKPGTAPVQRRPALHRTRALLGSLAVTGLTLGLVVVAATLVERRLTITDLPAPGRLLTEGRDLRAIADGQLLYFAPDAAEGEVLLSIASTSGETLSLAMPCDCDAQAAPGVAEGGTVLAGEPLVRLSEPGAGQVIEASVPAEIAAQLQEDGGAQVRLGGEWHFAPLSGAGIGTESGANGAYQAVLRPEIPVGATQTGQLVDLRIRHGIDGLLTPVTDLWRDLAGWLSRPASE